MIAAIGLRIFLAPGYTGYSQIENYLASLS